MVITGAGTGIGAACARLYAQEGAHLVLIGRRRVPLEQVAQDTGGLILVGDAACPDTWDGFIQQIRTHFGRLDVLLACAGGHGLGSATQTSLATWEGALRSNLDSAFLQRSRLPAAVAGKRREHGADWLHRLIGSRPRGVWLHHCQACAARAQPLAGP